MEVREADEMLGDSEAIALLDLRGNATFSTSCLAYFLSCSAFERHSTMAGYYGTRLQS